MRPNHTAFLAFANRSLEHCLSHALSGIHDGDTTQNIDPRDLPLWVDVVGEILKQAETRWHSANMMAKMVDAEQKELEVIMLKARTIVLKQMESAGVETIRGHHYFASVLQLPKGHTVRIGRTKFRGRTSLKNFRRATKLMTGRETI